MKQSILGSIAKRFWWSNFSSFCEISLIRWVERIYGFGGDMGGLKFPNKWLHNWFIELNKFFDRKIENNFVVSCFHINIIYSVSVAIPMTQLYFWQQSIIVIHTCPGVLLYISSSRLLAICFKEYKEDLFILLIQWCEIHRMDLLTHWIKKYLLFNIEILKTDI